MRVRAGLPAASRIPVSLADLWPWLPGGPEKLRALDVPETRRQLTADDPLLFAAVYLAHHLRSPETGDQVTLSPVHEEWASYAKGWLTPLPGPREERDAFVAPRGMGKSTWFFLVLPMWAAAHGHIGFLAAFADSATQAETHLATFRHELDTNELLRRDYPDLCAPARRKKGEGGALADGGVTRGDRQNMLYARSGFVFAARGIDSAVLGMKVGNRRPDLMVFDDVEPEEARYSGDQVKKRLGTLRDGVFPLNENARVVIVGTVTMPGSIIHQLVRSARLTDTADDKPEAWISEERIRVHYHPPILTADDGTESSVWPGRWSMEFLESIRHTRSFLKNYANDPRGYEGGYWSDDDFTYGSLPVITRRLLSIDPAVTTKKTSDPSALAVLGRSPDGRMCQVEHCESVRLTGDALRDHALRLVEKWDEAGTPIDLVYIETNQGGDVWLDVFHNFPVPVKTVHQSAKKEVRAAEALSYYQRDRVRHVQRLASAEEQMVSFPNAPHDDEVDAIGSGVLRMLNPPKRKKLGTGSVSTL